MNLSELLTEATKISSSEATATYWAHKLEQDHADHRSPEYLETQAAILEQATHKYVIDEGKLVGAIAFNVKDDAVHVAHLGSFERGRGKELLELAVRAAKRKKVRVVLVPSKSAEGFYKKLGFEPTGEGQLWALAA